MRVPVRVQRAANAVTCTPSSMRSCGDLIVPGVLGSLGASSMRATASHAGTCTCTVFTSCPPAEDARRSLRPSSARSVMSTGSVPRQRSVCVPPAYHTESCGVSSTYRPTSTH